jgi:hypothetical protein
MDEERLPQNILNWVPTGRKKRGRLKTRWKEGALRTTRDGDWEDRLYWRLGVEKCRTSFNDCMHT